MTFTITIPESILSVFWILFIIWALISSYNNFLQAKLIILRMKNDKLRSKKWPGEE